MSKHRDPAKHAAPTPTLWNASTLGDPLPEDAVALAIRDSLYDLIPLGQMERALINTPAFLRLQQIKQLGFVYRIWPGATHTRYEHSLGVFYLALRAVRLLGQRRVAGLRAAPGELRTLLAAALLHDIGHYPFSHAIEELGFPIVSHETIGRGIITGGAVAEALERHGVDPHTVADLIAPPRGYAPSDTMRVLARLLSGALDVDKLDYLPRDARACNVPYGGVDVTRLLGALRVEGQDDAARLAVDAKGISPLNSLVHARQEMFDNIYWHHTGRAMIIMLLRAVQEALLAQAIAPEDLAGHDDASLLAFLAHPRMPAATRALVAGLQQRQAYKVVVELSSRAGRLYQQLAALFWDAPKRRRAELALAEELGAALGQPVPDWGLLIDIPKPEKWEMDVTVIFDTPPLGMQRVMTWTEATGQTGDDLSRYETHQRRVRVVAAPELRDAARAHTDALLARLERLAVV
jgi:HD superfamily phosphohydrolase